MKKILAALISVTILISVLVACAPKAEEAPVSPPPAQTAPQTPDAPPENTETPPVGAESAEPPPTAALSYTPTPSDLRRPEEMTLMAPVSMGEFKPSTELPEGAISISLTDRTNNGPYTSESV